MEVWKQYRNTNYEVSNLGNVRNKETQRLKTQFYKYNGKKENDYVRVSLYLDGKEKNIPVHRMVAECFIKDFNDKLEVNHKNNKRWDNRVENLEMTTKEQNYQHSLKYGNGSQRKPVCMITENGEKNEFKSLWEAAKYIKIKLDKKISIDHICNNIKQNIYKKTKKSYDCIWEWSNDEYSGGKEK